MIKVVVDPSSAVVLTWGMIANVLFTAAVMRSAVDAWKVEFTASCALDTCRTAATTFRTMHRCCKVVRANFFVVAGCSLVGTC